MISVVILAKNEEKNISNVIDNAKLLTDKVLVIECGSTDRTPELAKAHGAKIFYRVWDNDFAAQRNFALEYVDTQWVLYLDADERMSENLIESVKKVIAENKEAVYQFRRRTSAFGKEFKYGVLSPDKVKRMFPVKKAKWQGKVHEDVKSDLPVVKLGGYIRHYTYKDFDQYTRKMNVYSSIWAKESNKKVSFIKDLVLRPIFAFVKMYVLKCGFLEGWLGFTLSVYYASYTFNKYAKLKLLQEHYGGEV